MTVNPKICPRCGKKIKPLRTTGGARITLDARPNKHGTYRLTKRWNFAMADREELAVPLNGRELDSAREHDTKLYTPHLGVCTGRPAPRHIVTEEP